MTEPTDSTEPTRPNWDFGGLDELDDAVTVCPEHLRFVPCRTCPPGAEQYSSDPADVARARAFQAEEYPACRTTGHENVPADVEGTFDCSAVNGREPSPGTYCIRCAIVLEFGGMFTAERVLRPVDVEKVAAGYGPKTWAGLLADDLSTLRLLT